jgi:hypothetical protein
MFADCEGIPRMLGKTGRIDPLGAPRAVARCASIVGRKAPPAKVLEPHSDLLLTGEKKFVNSSSTLYVVV